MLRKFFTMNRGLSEKIESRLPQIYPVVYRIYEEIVAERMNSGPDQVVVDVGGGKSCPFAGMRDLRMNARIVAVDVSPEEMAENDDVDEKRVADITRGLPFEEGSVDLVVSRSVLEHLRSVEDFVASSERILKPGGYSIHLFPSKFAPFALINQALPNRIAKRMLYFFRPEQKGIGGFPAFYDKCHHSAIRATMERHGFEVVDERLSYYQSFYFAFFAPLFLLSALYEAVVRAFGAKDLAAFVLIVARKKPE